MKYRFLLVGALLSSATVFGQSALQKMKAGAERSDVLQPSSVSGSAEGRNAWTQHILSEDEGQVIMSEDFSAGIPAGWTNSPLNGGNAIWEYRGPSTTPNANTGSRGAYATGLGPIQSTTRTNGFVIFDSDWWDNGGTAGGTGQQSASNHNGALTTGSIDCSLFPNVILTFESYTRNFNSNMWVIVSNNNFSTADTFWNGYDFTGTNEMSPTDDLIKLDISSVAGGEANVKVRFLYSSETGNNLDAGYYFWMLDDIVVSSPADWDLSLDETFFQEAGSFISNFQYVTYPNRIPTNQSANAAMTFGAAVKTWGAQTQPNAQLTVTVTGADNTSFTSAPFNSNFDDNDTVNVTTTYSPSDLGTYNVNFAVASDSADDYDFDNERDASFEVTERVYAWDDDAFDGGISWSSATHSMFQRFEFFAADNVSAIEIGIWSSATFASQDGSVVEVGIWPITAYNGGTIEVDWDNGASTFYTLSSSDFNTMTTVTLSEPFAVAAGDYVAGYRYQAGAIRTAYSEVAHSFFSAFVDVESDGEIDGWIDNVPLIHVVTWDENICDNTTIVVSGNVTCDAANYEATIASTVVTTGSNTDYTYEWSTNETTEDIVVDAEGTYSLTVTDGNFCEGSGIIEVANADINCNLAVGDMNGASFEVAVLPNPNNGVFNLMFSTNESESAQVLVQSVKGEIVRQEAITVSNGRMVEMNMSDLAAGIYIVKVVGATHTAVERIIIE